MEFNKTVSVTKPEMFFEVSSGEEVLVAEVAEVRLNPLHCVQRKYFLCPCVMISYKE